MPTPPIESDYPRREFRTAPARLHHGLLIAGLLAATGIGILAFGGGVVADGPLIAAVSLALAAAVALYAVRGALDPRPRMVLDADGVWFRDWRLPPIPWHRIAGVPTAGSRLQPYVSVELADVDGFVGALDDRTQRRCRSNRLIHWPRLMVPNHAIDASFEEVLNALRAGNARTPSPTRSNRRGR